MSFFVLGYTGPKVLARGNGTRLVRVLASEKVDDLTGVLHDADSEQLLAIVAACEQRPLISGQSIHHIRPNFFMAFPRLSL